MWRADRGPMPESLRRDEFDSHRQQNGDSAMVTDRQGNRLNGASATAGELFDAALDAFNVYRGDPIAMLDQALEDSPDFAMAKIFKAHLFALATEPEATVAARAIVGEAKRQKLDDREASHVCRDRTVAGG